MAASLAELPELWRAALEGAAEPGEMVGLSRTTSYALSMSDSAGNSSGSLTDFAQLAYSFSPKSISRSSMSSLGSVADTPQRHSEDTGTAPLLAVPPQSARECDAVVKLTASVAAADHNPPTSLAGAAGPSANFACGSSSAASRLSLFSAPASLEPLPPRAGSPSLGFHQAHSLPGGLTSEGSSPCAGPPPDVLLAALSASLMAKQQQEQMAASLAADPATAGGSADAAAAVAAPTHPACACASCHMVFADVAAYRSHCASQEHSVNIVHASLAMSMPRVASATTGIPQLSSHQGTAAPTAPSQPPLSVPMPVRGSSTARTLARCPSASSGLEGGSSRHGAADMFSEMRVSDSASAGQHVLPSVPSMPSMAALSLTAPAIYLGSVSYSGASLTPCCDQLVDSHLDALAYTLLRQLRQLDAVERAGAAATAVALEQSAACSRLASLAPCPPPAAADPALAALPNALLGPCKPARRLVGGLREVRKAVKSGSAVAVVAAVDIQESNPFDRSTKPAADIAEIYELARARGVAVVFALNRIGLGSVFGTNKRMSAVALTNVSGLEGQTGRMLQMAEVGRAQWAARVRARPSHPHA